MKPVYRWKTGVFSKLDVSEVAAELDDIATAAPLTAPRIVDRARPEESKLHPAFEWDDGIAAEKYRERQAADMVRNIVRVVVRGDEYEDVHTRAFVSVSVGEEPEYMSSDVVMVSAPLRAQILAKAYGEMESFRRKYMDLRELSQVITAIDSVLAVSA